jgi:TIR domain-containing protein
MPCLVFVSHRTRDLQTTERMVDVLRKALNLTEREVLFTGQVMTSLAPGQSVDETLARELRDSKVVISLFTQASYGSVYQIMEMGAAWFTDKLIVTVVKRRDAGRLPQPLIGDQSVPLDDRLHIVRLIEEIGKFIGRTPADAAAYETQLARLLSWTRRVEPFRRRAQTAVRAVAAVLAATVFVSYLLSRQNVQGQVITTDEGGAQLPVDGATVFIDHNSSGILTDTFGGFTFSVWNAFPRRHQIKIKPQDTQGHYSTYWRGPWPLQSLWQDSIDFRYDPRKPADERFYVVANRESVLDRLLSTFSGVVSAASRPSVATVAASSRASVSSDAEVGFFIDTVSTPKIPGLPFFKADRAFFKVWVAGRQLEEREVAAPSPLTLGRSSNLFPVESNRRSWISVSEKQTKFANLLCRLPLDLVWLIDASNRVIVGKDIVFQLSSDNGGILGQFMVKRQIPYAISQLADLRDTSTSSSSTLTVRPTVRLKPINLEWKPDDTKVRAGESLAISVSSPDPPVFPFEVALTQSGSAGAAIENLPRKVTLSPSRRSFPLNLLFAARPGRVKIVSHLPDSLRRPQNDDADVVVTPRR